MPGDTDWGQVIFLILVVVVGFIRWVANLIQQQKEAKERASLSPEELARREAAWRRQIGEEEEAPVEKDPFQELKDLFEQIKEPQRPAPAPPSLPKPPPPALRPASAAPPPLPAAVPASPPPQPSSAAAAAAARAYSLPASSGSVNRAFSEARPPEKRGRSGQAAASLRRELASPRALRQAVLMREILGPPKALREGA